MRADRLVSIVLLLQARGCMTARALAGELEVSVRTIYRDLEALGAAGVPVYAESGPGGGCRLLEGYRSPLTALSPDEAQALLALGVPDVLRQIGLGTAAVNAQRKVEASIRSRGKVPSTPTRSYVHLDAPAWFRRSEDAPELPQVAQAIRDAKRVRIRYAPPGDAEVRRVIDPLGIVSKAGQWYVVARRRSRTVVYRASRIVSAVQLDERFERPDMFDLVAFWDAWSAEFEASRPCVAVTVRASAEAVHAFPEVFGEAVRAAIDTASPPDECGWRTITLTFEHARAACHRLLGFGADVEIIAPTHVRRLAVDTSRATVRMYDT